MTIWTNDHDHSFIGWQPRGRIQEVVGNQAVIKSFECFTSAIVTTIIGWSKPLGSSAG